MRLILHALARANLRWAAADLARADRLRRDVDAAHDLAEVRLHLAASLASRATVLQNPLRD